MRMALLSMTLGLALLPISRGFTSGAPEPQAQSPAIHFNQVGYRPNDAKQAFIAGKGGAFQVIDTAGGKPVFSGRTAGPVEDENSADTISTADFSGLTTPGRYIISVSGVGRTAEFTIAEDVYTAALNATLKGLYFQRCGTALDEKYAGQWKHAACHLAEGVVFGTNATRAATGGWHDAGDYGRYTVAGAVAAADLLLAYEFFPLVFSDVTGIPESGNGVPDVLDEARWELAWLLKMQDESSGGVYHKLTSSGFPDLTTMPEADAATMVFSPISSTATGDFAAIMAMAARIFRSFDADFAAECLASAEKAWGWLQKNPNAPAFHNPIGITTGEYGDERDADERYWAAAELYRSTGNAVYNDFIRALFKGRNPQVQGFGWQNVGGFGSLAYCLTDPTLVDAAIVSRLVKDDFTSLSHVYMDARNRDGYSITLKAGEYGWGSNMNLMNEAILLIATNKLNPSKDLLPAALDDLHYLLGRNTLGVSFITGIGSRSAMHIHHRPSIGDFVKPPVPGLVSGGPNRYLQDPYAKANLQGLPPAKCWADDATSYSTNEIAIYWNAPAVFSLACFQGSK